MTFIMKKKKYKFNVQLTVDDLTYLPYSVGVLYAKCRLLDGGSFQQSTDRKEVEDHTIKWRKSFQFAFKTTANASTGILDPCTLRLSIRKEIKGGKSHMKLGFADVNLSSLAGQGLTKCRCLLDAYDSKGRHRQDNSLLHFTIDIKLVSGDPCFKTPKSMLMFAEKQNTNDIAPDDLDMPAGAGHHQQRHDTTPNHGLMTSLILSDNNVINTGDDNSSHGVVAGPVGATIGAGNRSSAVNSTLSPSGAINQAYFASTLPLKSGHHQQFNGCGTLPDRPVQKNGSSSMLMNGGGGGGSNGNAGGLSADQMTSSTTSFANSVSSSNAFDVNNCFEQNNHNHSRSNSSQTSSSRISTGFNSLPSHSRQGSADSEVTSRHPAASDIKFNSVDRVGKRLNAAGGVERTVKPVYGLDEPCKKAVDSTRIPADQLVDELFQTNQLFDPSSSDIIGQDSNGDLQLFVSKDGSATIGSIQQRPDSTFTVRTNVGDSNSARIPVKSRAHRN